jgi:hypothetical protein
VADFTSKRRYCLYKRLSAALLEQDAIASLWQSKQSAEPGTDLPNGFPSKDRLSECGYTTNADLLGSDPDELAEYVGLTTTEAEAVLAALALI